MEILTPICLLKFIYLTDLHFNGTVIDALNLLHEG